MPRSLLFIATNVFAIAVATIAPISLVSCRHRLPTTVEIDASLATTAWLESHYGFESETTVRTLLARVAKRLAGGVYRAALENESKAALESELLHYDWEVIALRSNEVNAFSVGAGMIFVTTGLLRRLNAESELAAILAHEMSHQLLGHNRQVINETELSADMPQRNFSLDYEIAADNLGLKIMKVARYDIRYALTAITLNDRNLGKNVADTLPDWKVIRYANLRENIDQCQNYLPATSTSREFTRMQNRLAGAS